MSTINDLMMKNVSSGMKRFSVEDINLINEILKVLFNITVTSSTTVETEKTTNNICTVSLLFSTICWCLRPHQLPKNITPISSICSPTFQSPATSNLCPAATCIRLTFSCASWTWNSTKYSVQPLQRITNSCRQFSLSWSSASAVTA